MPSVVQINVSSVSSQDSTFQNPFFRFFGRPEDLEPQEYLRRGLGSGTIIRKEGELYYVLTNNHVIKSAEDIEVLTYDGQRFAAEIVGSDNRVDLAVLKFQPDKNLDSITIADLGNSGDLRIGDLVMAIGSPDGFQSTVTQGIVSYIGRRGGPGNNINDFIQTDASINKGNSGGPLVNMNGQIIGINTWIASESGSSAGLGFAIPINNAKVVIESFLKEGKLSYGWLGVTVPNYQALVAHLGNDVSKEVFSPLGIYGKQGAFVADVYSDSPAGKAGLLPGDFIIELNGKAIKSSDELTFEIGILRPQQEANLRLIRSGREQKVRVILGERQSAEKLAKGLENNWPGISVLPLSKKVNAQIKKLPNNSSLASDENSGLIVLSVLDDSPIQVVGIRRGDVITKINGKKVRNLLEFYRELNKNSASNTIFTYKRKGYELETPKIRLR